MKGIQTIGVDLAKTVFHLVCMDETAQIVQRRKGTRPQLLAFFATLEPVLVGMEACAPAHFIARSLAELGHDARLMPARCVKPDLGTRKNDFPDAGAIAEAVRRPRLRTVPIKTREQVELQAMHRVREPLVSRRPAVSTRIRGLLGEHRITIRKGRGGLRGLPGRSSSEDESTMGCLPPAEPAQAVPHERRAR